MSKKPPVHISVTVDFLKELPELLIHGVLTKLEVENNQKHLEAALRAVGFSIDEQSTKFQTSVLRGVKVRCAQLPSTYRHTDIYTGCMIPGYEYPNLYKDGLLDTGSTTPEDFCINLPFDIPVEIKANTRKYTKKNFTEEFIEIEDQGRLDDIFGINDGLGVN